MKLFLLVLANLSEAAPTARYAAALGRPLGLHLALLHHDLYPALLEPTLVAEAIEQLEYHEAETLAALRTLAGRLPVPTEVVEASGLLKDDVAAAIRRYHPLLLAMSLGPELGLLDELLRNQVLPVLRATSRPVLLLPAAAPAATLPRRVLVAVDGEPFALAASSRALSELLVSWGAVYTVAHTDLPQEQPGAAGQRALAGVRASKLLLPTTALILYEVAGQTPAAGILQAAADTQADLLVLITRPRSFLGALFHHSVTAEVLRHTPVPVLLLPAAG